MWGTYSGHRKVRIGKAGIAAILICIAIIALIIIAAVNAPPEHTAPAVPDDGDTGLTIAEYNNAYGQDDSSVTVSRDGTVTSR